MTLSSFRNLRHRHHHPSAESLRPPGLDLCVCQGSGVKNLPASAGDMRDMGSIPGSGRSPGVGNGHALQHSCLGKSMDRGAWRAAVHAVAAVQSSVVSSSLRPHGLQRARLPCPSPFPRTQGGSSPENWRCRVRKQGGVTTPPLTSPPGLRIQDWLFQHGRNSHSLSSLCPRQSESEVAQSCPTLATPRTVAYQASLSMGFSRQEYWSGVPFPSSDLPHPGIEPGSPTL